MGFGRLEGEGGGRNNMFHVCFMYVSVFWLFGDCQNHRKRREHRRTLKEEGIVWTRIYKSRNQRQMRVCHLVGRSYKRTL